HRRAQRVHGLGPVEHDLRDRRGALGPAHRDPVHRLAHAVLPARLRGAFEALRLADGRLALAQPDTPPALASAPRAPAAPARPGPAGTAWPARARPGGSR